MGLTAKWRRGFYYDQLDIDRQFMYRSIASAVADYQASAFFAMDEKDLHRVAMALKYDNPEFFYWNADASVLSEDSVQLRYLTETEEEAKNLVVLLRDKRRQILVDLSDEETLSQKDMLNRVYSYLARTIRYAEDELQKPGCAPWIYDIQGPLLKERAVCLGIAQTVNYFCEVLHIPSLLITGEATVAGFTGNHGWNMVCLGGEYFHLDVTSEICDTDCTAGSYYLLKDVDMKDRKWMRSVYPQAK